MKKLCKKLILSLALVGIAAPQQMAAIESVSSLLTHDNMVNCVKTAAIAYAIPRITTFAHEFGHSIFEIALSAITLGMIPLPRIFLGNKEEKKVCNDMEAKLGKDFKIKDYIKYIKESVPYFLNITKDFFTHFFPHGFSTHPVSSRYFNKLSLLTGPLLGAYVSYHIMKKSHNPLHKAIALLSALDNLGQLDIFEDSDGQKIAKKLELSDFYKKWISRLFFAWWRIPISTIVSINKLIDEKCYTYPIEAFKKTYFSNENAP